MAKIYAVCSGCGGVGKTMIALSLAVSAAKRGRRTILLDASGVSRACDLALGLENVVVLDMADVANRQAGLEAALYKAPKYENLRFACASLYDDVPVTELTSTMLALHSLCDVLVIDCQTGARRCSRDRDPPGRCLHPRQRTHDDQSRNRHGGKAARCQSCNGAACSKKGAV